MIFCDTMRKFELHKEKFSIGLYIAIVFKTVTFSSKCFSFYCQSISLSLGLHTDPVSTTLLTYRLRDDDTTYDELMSNVKRTRWHTVAIGHFRSTYVVHTLNKCSVCLLYRPRTGLSRPA